MPRLAFFIARQQLLASASKFENLVKLMKSTVILEHLNQSYYYNLLHFKYNIYIVYPKYLQYLILYLKYWINSQIFIWLIFFYEKCISLIRRNFLQSVIIIYYLHYKYILSQLHYHNVLNQSDRITLYQKHVVI